MKSTGVVLAGLILTTLAMAPIARIIGQIQNTIDQQLRPPPERQKRKSHYEEAE